MGKGSRMGIIKISAMNEWRSRLVGPSGLVLLLYHLGLWMESKILLPKLIIHPVNELNP